MKTIELRLSPFMYLMFLLSKFPCLLTIVKMAWKAHL
jgi:hypothetical protein